MNRIKTLSFPLVSLLFGTAALPLSAQLSLSLSSDIDYRQNKKGKMEFRGGDFDAILLDGSSTNIGGCAWFQYYPPGFFNTICSPGTTGLITSGTVNGVNPDFPYLLVTSIFPAFAIAPREADKAILYAAPESTLPRPQAGFTDDSYSLFYNLTSTDIREYIVTRYYQNLSYSKKQEKTFTSQIVPGVYYYSFPTLSDAERPAPISAVIYPMIEAERTKNNTTSGFLYSDVNNNKWSKKGFVELSYRKPNTYKWIGVGPSNVFAAVDKSFFAIKALKNQKDPKSDVLERFSGEPISVFPPYVNGADPQVELTTPFTSQFTTPPIFESGTTGVVQIEFERDFQTGGVTYDFSKRVFQIPVIVVDRYTEYQDVTFSKSNKTNTVLLDTDGDGYNNLTEWILDSNANSEASIPIAPVPDFEETFDPFFNFFFDFNFIDYFGFDVKKKLKTKPRVKYTLQVSTNNGRTWKKFKTDTNWSVETVNFAASGTLPRQSIIQVRSLYSSDGFFFTNGLPVNPAQPPGTEGDIYRVKITQK